MTPMMPVLKNATLGRLRHQIDDPVARQHYVRGEPFEFAEDDLFSQTMIRPATAPPHLRSDVGPGERASTTDAENAILIHKYLPRLSAVQAADERLWVYLTHSEFMAYSAWRWSVREDPEKQTTDISSHWFVAGGKAGLRRNAVARLWWAAHLTHAPWSVDEELECFRKNDDYHYTRLLLKNQDIYQGIVERNYGSNLRTRIVILAALDHALEHQKNATRLITSFVKSVNLLSSYTDLGALDVNSAMSKLDVVIGAARDAAGK